MTTIPWLAAVLRAAGVTVVEHPQLGDQHVTTIPWLAAVLRAAGVTVVEHPGWQTRAAAGSWQPTYGVVHATAAPRSQSDADQVQIVRDGRAKLSGPIANACVDRQGRWHVLAAGRCNTTLVGTGGPYAGLGNTNALGVEACNDNGLATPAEPWPAAQYDAYAKGWAAICNRLGWTASNLVGHKEHCPGRKTDPSFGMDRFRARVATYQASLQEDDPVPFIENQTDFSMALATALRTPVVADALADAILSNQGVPPAVAVNPETGKPNPPITVAAALRDAGVTKLFTVYEQSPMIKSVKGELTDMATAAFADLRAELARQRTDPDAR